VKGIKFFILWVPNLFSFHFNADEFHALELGRNIIRNIHMAGKGLFNLQNIPCKFEEPLYDMQELREIAPTDQKQPFDIRSVIARVVDGSEFDEFKKLYGAVRTLSKTKVLTFVGFSFK
jgi:3-methylcrotonyl-CoA carboxylase beta subunit